MGNKNLTAVEWLVEKLENEATMDYSFSEAHKLITLDIHSFNKLFQQANQMEKQQIADAWHSGNINADTNDFYCGEQYYNETYKNK